MSVSVVHTQEEDSEKPPSSPTNHLQWLVAVIANVKGESHHSNNGPADAGAEYDKPETIQAIREAIESAGHRTVFLNAYPHLPFSLRDVNPDICFNIAEGSGNDAREAQVPALLAMLHIPYTASRVLANAISLDKPLTKRLWREARLPVCPYQVFVTGDEPLEKDLRYPLFIKPAMEGTGMGVDLGAKVTREEELRKRIAWVLETYSQPALVETYLPGREFTVGVMGRPDAKLYSPRPELYRADGFHRFPILEIESRISVTPGVYGYDAKAIPIEEAGAPAYICPAHLDPKLADRLQRLALGAHKAIGALDVSRVDVRLGEDDKPYLMEINTLPGLNPEVSDLCIVSAAEGLSYRDLILEILYLGASRYGMVKPQVTK